MKQQQQHSCSQGSHRVTAQQQNWEKMGPEQPLPQNNSAEKGKGVSGRNPTHQILCLEQQKLKAQGWKQWKCQDLQQIQS